MDQIPNTILYSLYTVQSISSLGKVPIEILPGKHNITWVLAVLPFSAEFQMEPLTPNAISCHMNHMILEQPTHVILRFLGRISIETFPSEDIL